ncbi:GNAT family N-acetyltransferase [Vibrio panuliri]|uniref:GNAT family N-acetyltransferase n=1 Tax=Vibrio panuliri TaxID=1381081 RepID=A0A1Q9HFI8_9VIBR|nr:GNAT family N-acetyltransferase [Vibrio panuliri]OLQ88468.1 GNAT family N-acetyltransferase [Vibrio panuliri]
MAISYLTRAAIESDYEFLFELKKTTEKQAIANVFGWDESIQWQIHKQEWEQAKPLIIQIDGEDVGSVLIEQRDSEIYLGRFFILPHIQGRGLGSTIIQDVIKMSQKAQLPISLLYLQGNRVGQLYRRHGFVVTSETDQFVYMQRPVA